MPKKQPQFKFENVSFTFEHMPIDESRIKKISGLIFGILDDKIKTNNFDLKSNAINLDNLSLPKISVSENMSDADIAKKIATEILLKLQKDLS